MSISLSTAPDITIQDWSDVTAALDRYGFAIFDSGLAEHGSGQMRLAREAFIASCRNLPSDRYSHCEGRYRRYGRFKRDRETGAFGALPPIWATDRKEFVVEYRQPGRFNPEQNGAVRQFSSLTEEQTHNPFLKFLIGKCFSAVSWKLGCSVIAGVHVVEYVPSRNKPVYSSPSHFHCDGEPFTWAFLLNRTCVAGGENIISRRTTLGKYPEGVAADDIYARFTLNTELDGWVVDDFRVCHYVSPVTLAEGTDSGRRVMLLIDFDYAWDAPITGV